jgi:U3 small nucleolar RNA-associated protein 14
MPRRLNLTLDDETARALERATGGDRRAESPWVRAQIIRGSHMDAIERLREEIVELRRQVDEVRRLLGIEE